MARSRQPSTTHAALLALALGAGAGCKRDDTHREARARWMHQQVVENQFFLRSFLNGTGDMVFYDGWYTVEHDPSTKGAWRWMERRGVVRLRTRPDGRATTTDMELTVFGWLPKKEDLGQRSAHLEFALNGHVLDRLAPPDGPFEHKLFVPRHLLDNAEFVDFAITAANTARPRGDWRDLGFATTGFKWKPVGPT